MSAHRPATGVAVPGSRPPGFGDYSAVPRPFGDATIESLVVGGLSGVGGVGQEGAIQWWSTMTRPNTQEISIMGNPAAIGDLHARTARMIERNSGLYVDYAKIGPTARAHLATVSQAQRAALRVDDGSKLVQTLLRQRRTGKRSPVPTSEGFQYAHYAAVQSTRGPVYLSERTGSNPLDGVRPIITYQEGASDTFIHWSTTPALEQQTKTGKRPPYVRRIYLNPQMQAQPEVFEEIMTALNAAGLTVAGKMLDRAGELAVASAHNPSRGTEPDVRTDGIILGLLANEADTALGIVASVHRKHLVSFSGRPVPKISQQVAEGVSVGDQSPERERSPTQHRASAMAAASVMTRAALGVQPGQRLTGDQRTRLRSVFETAWSGVAARVRINPHNPAWNKG